ncbi:hypothetical protein ACFE04_012582 [Oxalis oulophora]
MVDAWWGILGAAIPAVITAQALRMKKSNAEEQRIKTASIIREKNSDEIFVCERVCTSKRMLNKVGAFSKDPIPDTCVTVCGVSELDACSDACARTVCVNQHQVPNWNDICLRRCQSECLKIFKLMKPCLHPEDGEVFIRQSSRQSYSGTFFTMRRVLVEIKPSQKRSLFVSLQQQQHPKMGNSQSPPADPRFNSATRAFTQTELKDLHSLFTSLAAQSNSDGQFISLKIFEAYIGLTAPLADRLFRLITSNHQQQQLTYEQLVIAKATYEKGTNDDIDEFVYQLLHANGDDCLDRPGLQSNLLSMFDHIFRLNAPEAETSSHQESIEPFLNAAIFSRDDNQSGQACMSFDDFGNWCTLIPSARKFLGSLLNPPDPGLSHSLYILL